jgi:hypothetical protein
MPEIGASKLTGSLMGSIKESVDKAMADAHLEIGAAVTELVSEIKDGKKQVVRALNAEAMKVRQQFGSLVGNAEGAGDEAVAEAEKAVGEHHANGSGA